MEKQQGGATASATMTAKLKIAGAWSGVLEVRLDEWTVSMLRAEVSRRSGTGHPPECINLISGGKVLKDESCGEGAALTHHQTLLQAGLKNNSKILACSVDPAAPTLAAEEKVAASEEERSRRLSRIRDAAEKLAGRHVDGSLPLEDYNIELEDQNGQKVKVGSENDQRGVMMGLMLHANAKKLMKKRNYKDALEVLAMGEEAFSLCDPKLIEMIDNVPILQIDTVWCYFILRDISWLSMAGKRLADARKGFERSHGKDSSRFRLLQAGRHAELAIYLRLELLEGVVAYHTGQLEKSLSAISSAKAKYLQLQVPDEPLSLLISMGYKERSAKRALRMTNQDVSSAIDFLVEERATKTRRREEDIQRQNEIREQKSYGMTPQKKAVDIQRLNDLVSIGFERSLAAEALRVNENDTQKALDDLTNPDINSKLQLCIQKRKQPQENMPNEADIENIVSMGYDRSAVVAALRDSATIEEALCALTTLASENNNIDRNAASSSTNNTASSNNNPSNSNVESAPSGLTEGLFEQRDVEMEEEIANELTGDPLADYDIEVTQEGDAIMEYLALLMK